MTDIDAGELAKRRPYDWAPLLLVPLLALAALPLIGSLSTWATLTAAGLAMGMIIFIIASGLTLVFGLMDVLNFGHGAFISVGAYVAAILLAPLSGLLQADSLVLNGVALLALIALAMTATGLLGWAFERIIIMPVYGQHLKQILVTVGGMIVAQQLIIVLWGPVQLAFPLPSAFRGAIVIGDVAIERYRVIAVVVGLLVFAGMLLVLNRTKIGLLIRAGVENRAMVTALGIDVRRAFTLVFAIGGVAAAVAGVLSNVYFGTIDPQRGTSLLIFAFIVVVIGGLGSIGGSAVSAMVVALTQQYTNYYASSGIGDMVVVLLLGVVLLARPRGFAGAAVGARA